jgi:ADP-heptose:LPS heptosyltransferase
VKYPVRVPAAPKSIIHIRPDTIGDLVIYSPVLEALGKAWPDARQTIVVRPGYEALEPLLPEGVNWITAPFNPFAEKPGACRKGLGSILAKLELLEPDLIVAGTLNRTWLELAIAHHFPKARRVALGDRSVDPLFEAALRLEYGHEIESTFDERAKVEPNARDWDSYADLVGQLTGKRTSVGLPQIRIPADAASQAGAILKKLGLPEGGWAAVFPAGIANVPIKAWPADHFAELVIELEKTHSLPVALLGHQKEKAVLEEVANLVKKRGGKSPATWLGKDGELALLAALLGTCRVYAGNDTGAMHLAAAAGRPVLGIFGGGHWPRFCPAARQSVSVVQPLPCFNCNWDCPFGDAPCVRTIPAADVLPALGSLLAAGRKVHEEVIETSGVPESSRQLIASAGPAYRALQRDRIDRQHRIEELKRETDGKDAEIAALKQEADVKDAEIASLKRETDAKDTEIADLKETTEGMETEIADLKVAAEERKTEMESIKAELEAECASKDREIAELKAEADGKDSEIAALKQVNNEREALIIELDGHVKEFQRIVAELNAAHGEKDSVIAALRAADAEARSKLKRLEELEWIHTRVPDPGNSAAIAKAIEDKEVHIRNVESIRAAREQEAAALRAALAERDTTIAHYVGGLGSLEASKHYGRLLAEKEAVIQSLNQACIERERVIRRLAVEATGFGPRVARLATGAREHWRLKIQEPFRAWLFRKVVEDYWMQIGILRHYDPRPIRWDRLPKSRLPEDRLPRIGIVTPSFGQAAFLESTMLSVLNQKYPRLHFAVQDGGSPEPIPGIIGRYADRLDHWASEPDRGQADAVRKGFSSIEDRLGPDDVMAWLNSDDFLAPRSLRFVGEYFAKHPEVDCVYGHRIIIDEQDREVGRWIMPPHEPKALEWIDYVPQETLFWRKRAWDRVGGIDPTFQFALDWDLIARFTQANLRVVRLPYFLGCFRVHPSQKTSAAIHTTGAEEMTRIRARFHGTEKQGDGERIAAWARRIRFRGGLTARLHALGIRL